MFFYCIIDTHVLSDLLIQFNPAYPNNHLQKGKFISSDMLHYLNMAIDSKGDDGLVVASTFSFVELLNKFDEIFKNTSVSIDRLKNFLEYPLSWFLIEDLDIDIAKYFIDVPLQSKDSQPISGDDAVILATALSRTEDKVYFMTKDKRLLNLNIKGITFVT